MGQLALVQELDGVDQLVHYVAHLLQRVRVVVVLFLEMRSEIDNNLFEFLLKDFVGSRPALLLLSFRHF